MDNSILFETDRLYFRVPVETDAEDMIVAANTVWDDIRKYMIFGAALSYDRDQAFYYLNVIVPDQMAKGALPLVGFCKKTNQFVIASGLSATDTPHVFTTGYWIPKNQQGKGYATEATLGILHYAFNHHGAKTVCISYYDGNTPSLNVIQKCGFEFVETKKDFAFSHGLNRDVDEHFYEMTVEHFMNRGKLCI